MSIKITAIIIAVVLCIPLTVAASGALTVVAQPSTLVTDAIGLRYKARVNANQNPTTRKILFGWKRFTGTASDSPYLLDTNLYSYIFSGYPNNACGSFPPAGTQTLNNAGLFASISDYKFLTNSNPSEVGRVGARQMTTETTVMFPIQAISIDGMPTTPKVEIVSQTDLKGKDIVIEYTRGATFTTPLSGWGMRRLPGEICDPILPSGITYRVWKADIIFDGVSYQLEFALPNESADKFASWEITSFVTEFFDDPGFFQVYLWDFEVLRESTGTWGPLKRWNFTDDRGQINTTYGPRVATYQNKSVLEFSNDGTDSYFKEGDIFIISDPKPIATTNAISSVTYSNATLNGQANPNTSATTGWFRYSTINPGSCNDSFGIRVPASGGTALGSGASAVPYSQMISGLVSNTTYYACAISSNSSGTAYGGILLFVTQNDTTPPTVSLTAPPSDGDTVSGSISIFADANDNVGVVGIQFQLDGADLGVEDTTLPYSFIWDTAQTTDGLHTLTAVARDSLNSVVSSPVIVTVSNVVLDTTPPAAPVGVLVAPP